MVYRNKKVFSILSRHNKGIVQKKKFSDLATPAVIFFFF